MPLTITNNISSLQAQTSLAQNGQLLAQTLQQLSTGLKINSGADGPAAYVISEEQQAQIAGINQAIVNTSTDLAQIQNAEGALSQISTLLTTARGLALSSANTAVNDTNTLNANQNELTNILQSINNIANTTQFGNKKLLDGTSGILVTAQPAGYTVNGTSSTVAGTYTLSGFTAATRANSLAANAFAVGGVTAGHAGNLTINGVNIALNATNASTLTDAIDTINTYSAETGVTAVSAAGNTKIQLVSNSFGSTGNFTASFASANLAGDLGFGAITNIVTASNTNGTAATDTAGTLTDEDGRTFIGTGNGNVLNFDSNLSITFGASGATSTVGANGDVVTLQNNSLQYQTGANAGQTATVALNSVQTTALGQNTQGLSNAAFTSLATLTINTTASDATDAVRVIDKALSDVSNESASLGAFQANYLQSNAVNLQTALTNTTAADSTIRDTDFAAATSNLAKYQVLTQAGAAVLSSSNQTTQLVLALLQKLG